MKLASAIGFLFGTHNIANTFGKMPGDIGSEHLEMLLCMAVLPAGAHKSRSGPLTDRRMRLFRRYTPSPPDMKEGNWANAVPCDTSYDYRQRLLPGAPELALSGIGGLDPRREDDRAKLIVRFCKALGITVGPERALWS